MSSPRPPVSGGERHDDVPPTGEAGEPEGHGEREEHGEPEERWLVAADGVRLSAVHLPGPRDLALVVAHGFSGSWRTERLRRVAYRLAAYGGVVAVDQRGHGRSGGVSTIGWKEVLDVDAAVRWARLLGYRRVATVGFSMGASVVVRHGALHRGVDAVVSVSGPAYWYYRGTRSMRVLHWAVESRVGRRYVRHGMRTRLDRPPWPDPPPMPPVEAAARLAPTPLLVVHGDADHYFPLEHALALHRAAAGGPAELWIEPGFGHAESAIPAAVLDRIGSWVRSVTGADAGHGDAGHGDAADGDGGDEGGGDRGTDEGSEEPG